MPTKEGERQLTAPHALSTLKAVHTVYEKGALLGDVEFRYSNSAENNHVNHRTQNSQGGVRSGQRPNGDRYRNHNALFAGSGVRLGGSSQLCFAFFLCNFDHSLETDYNRDMNIL